MHKWHQPALCEALASTTQSGPHILNRLPLYQDMLRQGKSKCSMVAREDHLLALDSDPASQKPGAIAEGHLPV